MNESRIAYPPVLLLVGALIAFITLIPLFFVVSFVIETGWDNAWNLVVRRRVAELLYNTTRLVVACTVLSAVIGTAAAWAVERTTLPGRGLWNALLVAPLAIPAFVNSFGWVSLTPRVEGFAGAVLIVTLSYYPFVYLPVSAGLRRLDPALEEAARSLGQSSWQTFTRVVLPQLRPSLLGGSLLVGLHLLAEFGALQMLRFPTFTTGIYDQFRSSFNSAAANMLASVLVLCCLVLLITELRLAGTLRYARLGSGAQRAPERRSLGWLTIPALAGVTSLAALALGVPIGSLVYWLAIGSSTEFPLQPFFEAATTSTMLGFVTALSATLIALPIAWLSVRHTGVVTTLFERATYVAGALPGIVVALALVTVSIRYAEPAYQTISLLIMAYVILFLPRAMVPARAALKQAPPILDDVAHALGAGYSATMRRVVLPLIAPGLRAGSALVFLAVVTELTATLLLAPTGVRTLATEFWNNTSGIEYGAAAPYAMLMIVISLPATYLLMRTAQKTDPS